jgi:hypothetical protein
MPCSRGATAAARSCSARRALGTSIPVEGCLALLGEPPGGVAGLREVRDKTSVLVPVGVTGRDLSPTTITDLYAGGLTAANAESSS